MDFRPSWTRSIILAALLVTALSAGTKPPPATPVDINTATVEQLKTLPGAGDSMAAAIVHYRAKNGPFRRVEELLIIKGISKKRLASWKPYLREVK
jgi:competence protein ComEA